MSYCDKKTLSDLEEMVLSVARQKKNNEGLEDKWKQHVLR